MKRIGVVVGFLLGLGLLLIALLRNEPSRPPARSSAAAPPPQSSPATRLPSSIVNHPSSIPDRSDLADALNSPATDIRSDLRVVAVVLDTFRSNVPRDGNPVGDNAEITAALAGRNRLGLSLIPPDHPAINAQGELCDRWGTPFFFHAVSGTQMEIRSAGPDRRMHTADDIVQEP